MKKKILFTTVTRKSYDYFQENTQSFFRPGLPRWQSVGLRFLKQNFPSIEILEYPSEKQFIRKLKEGWDVLGFSFFLNETKQIQEMVALARNQGIQEIWGGNYGILTPSIQQYFDKVFIGCAEREIGKILDETVDDIIHPPLVWYLSAFSLLKIRHFGILFTSRGCKNHCAFCQTPSFIKCPDLISLKSIDRVLRHYKNLGIPSILILDENFGIFEEHSRKVVNLLGKYKFHWSVMTNIKYLKNNLEEWSQFGLFGALVGIENLSSVNLKSISKPQSSEEIFEIKNKMKEKLLFTLGFYIIGFENDTSDFIEYNFEQLVKLDLDFYQLCILTPFPQSPLWSYLDKKYGIFEKDFSKFDTKNLVWNHPSITPEKMKSLLENGLKKINPLKKTLSLLGPFKNGKLHYLNHLIKANFFNYKNLNEPPQALARGGSLAEVEKC